MVQHGNSKTADASSVSNAQAADALADALLKIDADRMCTKKYVVAMVHDCRGDAPNAEYFVEWCGYPKKADWNWQRQQNLQNELGKWTCPDAMAEFQQRRKLKQSKNKFAS